MAGKTKPLMFCPWCDEGQARTWQGINAHVRAKHPDKKDELKDNKDLYLEKFACDEFGNPTGGSPKPEPETPEPEPETPEVEAPAPKPKPKKKSKTKPPALEVKPPTPAPEPKPEPKPAEGGGFRKGIRNLTSAVFGD